MKRINEWSELENGKFYWVKCGESSPELMYFNSRVLYDVLNHDDENDENWLFKQCKNVYSVWGPIPEPGGDPDETGVEMG